MIYVIINASILKWVNKMHIQLMTDGGADIPAELEKETGIKIVPLYLRFSDQEYKTGEDLDAQTFYDKIKQLKQVPTSSAPSPNDFYEAYKKTDPTKPVLMLSLSKALSSTYANALLGKELMLEEEPDRVIEVINTKTASCGVALLTHEAKSKIDQGMGFTDLVAHIEERGEQTATLFILKSLENLILGGRLDRVKGAIAKTLNIKLLLKASDEGAVDVSEKIRGNKRALKRFVDQIGEYVTDFEDKIIVMTHSNAKDYAQKVLDSIMEKYPFKDALLTETGPLISTYADEEGLVISFFKA